MRLSLSQKSKKKLMIDTCAQEREMQLFLEWTVIRKCVAMILKGNGSTAAH
jgi:hypothetical protein